VGGMWVVAARAFLTPACGKPAEEWAWRGCRGCDVMGAGASVVRVRAWCGCERGAGASAACLSACSGATISLSSACDATMQVRDLLTSVKSVTWCK
jgi:hypothetical protein